MFLAWYQNYPFVFYSNESEYTEITVSLGNSVFEFVFPDSQRQDGHLSTLPSDIQLPPASQGISPLRVWPSCFPWLFFGASAELCSWQEYMKFVGRMTKWVLESRRRGSETWVCHCVCHWPSLEGMSLDWRLRLIIHEAPGEGDNLSRYCSKYPTRDHDYVENKWHALTEKRL